ncbi:DUF6158 family protein [Microbispora hainanensis]|jgi:hypothetical protein|uniref:DUF6158 family protein n=1 Tax=Microbispora hainanensis TaxID=568844 RepID=A0ABZ1T112_9ACTN|nr:MULTISPECIES: DUF6158 family protein [Microbispora]NJP24902.1 hypothetical protein [Microbispora sp. CL1-1]TQS14360.1 hypothetical protein FLW53_11920 [Microbispora sp. SCL1-1]
MTMGVDPRDLSDEDLIRELRHLHETRSDTLFHGSDDALEHHTSRMQELEREYLERYPDRQVDPERLREGARQRSA